MSVENSFDGLVKNLYTTYDKELSEEKLAYIKENYKGKEEDFVKNFYTTYDLDLPEEKLSYIQDTYLKKKDISFEDFKISMQGVSEMPKEYASEAPSTPIKPTLNTEIEKWYSQRGGLSPETKMNTFTAKVKDLNTQYESLIKNVTTQEEADKIVGEFNKALSTAASDLGMTFNQKEGKVELSENDLKFYEDAYRSALSKLPKEDKKRLTKTGEIFQGLNREFVAAGLGLREIAGSLLLLDYIPQYKETNENQRIVLEQQRYFDAVNGTIEKDISKSLENKDYKGALSGAILGTAESIPAMAISLFNPTYGLIVSSAIGANETYQSLKKDESISDLALFANVAGSFVLEYATEKLTTMPMVEQAKKALINIGKEEVENATSKTIKETLMTLTRRVGQGLNDANLESFSEVANQFGQNYIYYLTVDKNKNLMDGLVNAYGIGLTTSGVLKSPQIAIQSYDTAKNLAETAFNKTPKTMNVEDRVNSAVLIVEKDAIQEQNKGIDKSLQKDVSNEVAQIDSAIKLTAQPQTVKEQVNYINEQINEELSQPYPDVIKIGELETALNDIEQSIQIEGGKRLQEINKNIESLREERSTLYEGEQTEVQIQEAGKREQKINKELLPLLKEKQKIRNDIYEKGLGDINSELSQKLNSQAKEEGINLAKKQLGEEVMPKTQPEAIKSTEITETTKTLTQEKEALKQPEIYYKPLVEEVDKVKEGVVPTATPKVFNEVVSIANQVAQETGLAGEELIGEVGRRVDEITAGKITVDDIVEIKDEILPQIKQEVQDVTIQEQGATEMDVRQQARDGKEMAGGDAQVEAITEEGKKIEEPSKKKEVITKTEEEALSAEQKKRRMGVKALESANIPNKMKNDLINRGIEYVVRGKKVTSQIAKDIARVFTDSGGRDELKAVIMNPNIPMKGDVRTTLAVEFAKESLRLADLATTKVEKEKFQKDATDVFEYDMIESTNTAQALQSKSLWGEILGNNPDFIVASAKARTRKNNADFLDSRSDDVETAQQILDDFKKSKEFQDLVDKEAQAKTNEIIRRKKITREQIKKEQDYRQKRIEQYKKQKRGIASASIIGFTQEDIEFAGDMIASYVREGFFRLVEISNKLKNDFKDIGVTLTDEQIALILEQEKDGKKLSDILKEAEITPADKKLKVKDRDIKDVVEKIYRKTQGATKEEIRTLVRDYIDEIYESGAIDDERFQNLFAKALGQEFLSRQQEEQLRTAVEKLNEARKKENQLKELNREYLKAVEEKASKDDIDKIQQNIKEKTKEYNKAIEEARKANGYISETFGKENTIGDLFGTFIQGNLLTPISLITNIAANATWIPVRSSRNYVATAIDALLSTITGDERVYDSFGATRGYAIGFYEGLIEGIKQMWTGQLPDDVYIRDVSIALHPIKSIIENYNSLTGEEKIKKGKFIYNTLQATLGVPPEIMFRLLNLGDKPFRRAAEKARLSELAKLKGFKGFERENFMMFPDAESEEDARRYGLEATFQQDNVLTNMIRMMERSASKESKEKLKGIDKIVHGIFTVLKKTQIPYVKTPSNILIETLDYAVPEWSLSQSIYYAYKGNKRKAEDYAARAVVGYMITGAISTLMGLGIMSLAPGGRDDEDKKSERVKQSEYRNKNAYYMNLDALDRYLSGGDPTWQEGDDVISYKRFGILSSIMMSKAESYRGKTLQEIRDMDFVSKRVGSLFPVLKSSLDQSFLTGINGALNAATQGGIDADRWLLNTTKALSATVLPNTYSTVVKGMDNYIRETRVRALDGIEKNKKEIRNVFKSSLQTDSGLPTKVTVWGERVERVPDGKGLGYMLFDITKSTKYGSDFGVKLHELYERTGNTEILPSVVDGNITYKGKTVELTEKLTEQLQIEVGSARKKRIQPYVDSNNYDEDTDEIRLLKLKFRYDKMNREGGAVWWAKKKFERQHKEEIKKLYQEQFPEEK